MCSREEKSNDPAALISVLPPFSFPPSCLSPQGRTPLMAAAGVGHALLVAELIGRGAQLEATDCDGRTALWHACANGQDVAAATLLDFGACAALPAGESDGPTPLASAVAGGHAGIVALLLDRAAEEEKAAGGASANKPRARAAASLPATAASADGDGKGEEEVPAPISVAVRGQLTAALVAHAADLDEGEIARALARHLERRWLQPDPDTPGKDVIFNYTLPTSTEVGMPAAVVGSTSGRGGKKHGAASPKSTYRNPSPQTAAIAAAAAASHVATEKIAASVAGSPPRRSSQLRTAKDPTAAAAEAGGAAPLRAAESGGAGGGEGAGAGEGGLLSNYDPATGVDPQSGHPIWHSVPNWLDSVEGIGPKGVVTQSVRDEVSRGGAVEVASSSGSGGGRGGGRGRGRRKGRQQGAATLSSLKDGGDGEVAAALTEEEEEEERNPKSNFFESDAELPSKRARTTPSVYRGDDWKDKELERKQAAKKARGGEQRLER